MWTHDKLTKKFLKSVFGDFVCVCVGERVSHEDKGEERKREKNATAKEKPQHYHIFIIHTVNTVASNTNEKKVNKKETKRKNAKCESQHGVWLLFPFKQEQQAEFSVTPTNTKI